MLEIPQSTFNAPPPVPVPSARPLGPNAARSFSQVTPPPPAGQPPETDKVAVASSVCGLTAFIPILSQLIGLALGVWALFRIRRARQSGRQVLGNGWATAGVVGNGLVLLGWIGLFVIFALVNSTISQTTSELHPLLKKHPIHQRQFRK